MLLTPREVLGGVGDVLGQPAKVGRQEGAREVRERAEKAAHQALQAGLGMIRPIQGCRAEGS